MNTISHSHPEYLDAYNLLCPFSLADSFNSEAVSFIDSLASKQQKIQGSVKYSSIKMHKFPSTDHVLYRQRVIQRPWPTLSFRMQYPSWTLWLLHQKNQKIQNQLVKNTRSRRETHFLLTTSFIGDFRSCLLCSLFVLYEVWNVFHNDQILKNYNRDYRGLCQLL